MKQWVSERLFLLRSSLRYSIRLETAFFFANWVRMIASVAFTLAYILFIDILFRSVPTFAGYHRAEMLFFMFVSQLTFYATWIWSTTNVQQIEQDIRSGAFDLLLLKPLPLLFYAHTRIIRIISFLRDSPPALAVIGFAVPWSALTFRIENVLAAVALFLLGQLAINAVQSILILPAFWVPGARVLSRLPDDVIDRQIPAEALPRWFSLPFAVLVPLLLAAAFPAQVALGRFDPLLALAVGAGSTALILWIRSRLWAWALRSYTSASS